ncbi:MAG: hypothetical protein ACLRS8_03935 [Parabacteroides merdae]
MGEDLRDVLYTAAAREGAKTLLMEELGALVEWGLLATECAALMMQRRL